jgi:hypothetical protein
MSLYRHCIDIHIVIINFTIDIIAGEDYALAHSDRPDFAGTSAPPLARPTDSHPKEFRE